MIVKVSPERGKNTIGLVAYLFGPGRHNEHDNQRVVAAATTLGAADGTHLDFEQDWDDIVELGEAMDSHRKAMGIEVRGGHVWHCSLSLPPGESADRPLTDAQWAEAARYVVEKMGFDDGAGRVPCRWLAVHHGKSVGGNGHIHLAVNLVREDGTVASVFRDFVKMSTIAAELERRFGLHVVTGRKGGGMPGLSRGEIEQTQRHGKSEPDRVKLARIVRGCATAAASEADFVRQLKRAGVVARPRYAQGDPATVVGYSVALRTRTGAGAQPRGEGGGPEPLVWFGGGRLAPDLSLARLREEWPDWGAEQQRREALNEWSRSTKPRSSAAPGRAPGPGPDVWRQAAQAVARVREQLAAVPVGDTATWAGAAREAAGVLAAWSAQLEPARPGPLAAAADALARSALTARHQPRARRQGAICDLRGVARVCFVASDRSGLAGQVALLRQMIQMIEALQDAHQARGQAHQATELARLSGGQLTHLQRTLTAKIAAPIGVVGSRPTRPIAPPTPAPAKARGTSGFGRG